jgi:CBS domain-containing protein
MKIASILHTKGGDVTTVSADRPILEIVAELRQRGIGAVVIIGADGSVGGILSERDIVHALADHGEGLSDVTVGDLMTPAVTVCSPDDHVDDVMRQMSGGRFRHVPVVDNGKLAGIISIGDVVRARIDELERETEALQQYISG